MIDKIIGSYLGGVLLIIIGVGVILAAMKDDKNDKLYYRGSVKLWISGIMFVIMGITIIIAKIAGKI